MIFRNMRTILLFLVLFVFASVSCSSSGQVSVNGWHTISDIELIELSENGSKILINPSSLEFYKINGEKRTLLLSGSFEASEKVELIEKTDHSLNWKILRLNLELVANLKQGVLHLSAKSTVEQNLKLAVPTETASIIFPSGEGLIVPSREDYWLGQFKERACLAAHEGLFFPGWGVLREDHSVNYVLGNDLFSSFCLLEKNGLVNAEIDIRFKARDGFPVFELFVENSKPDPLASAKFYRRWLQSIGKFTPFIKKAKKNKEALKLLGAMHVYLWGDGRTQEFLDAIEKLGISSLSLVYDQNPSSDKYTISKQFIERAKTLGFLIGPYETFTNAMSPNKVDTPSSDWGGFFPKGCIRKKDGSIKTGFGGRGCELSSEALKNKTSAPNIRSRVEGHINTGANQIFLDVDAFGELHEDYHPEHSMTISQDRQNRIARMEYISKEKNILLGSEQNVAWSHGVTLYSHGSHTANIGAFWPILEDKKRMGGWWPSERPKIFFKKLEYSKDEVIAMYDPRYRLPLFQTVFHDSLISTERWELSLVKIKNLVIERTLFAFLYNAPPIWNLDLKELKNFGLFFSTVAKWFHKVHSKTGVLPLNSFEWLSHDHLVQKTVFGDKLEIIANFGDASFQKIGPKCLQFHWISEEVTENFCPPL